MYTELKKDDASWQKKSSDRYREGSSNIDWNSDLLSGETTEGFTSSPSYALPSPGQGQLVMQCKGLSENPEPTKISDPLIQRRVNNTGLPDRLKNGIENLSGYAMDDVRVHYNSSKPAQLRAHAYTQGTAIHVAPGQEQHLPHEAWHVVQQKQGRVKPTLQMKGKVNVNDEVGLEREADVMGAKALQVVSSPGQRMVAGGGARLVPRHTAASDQGTIQKFDWLWWLPSHRRRRRQAAALGVPVIANNHGGDNMAAVNPRFRGNNQPVIRFNDVQPRRRNEETLPSVPIQNRDPIRNLVPKKDVMGGSISVPENPDNYLYEIRNGQLVHVQTNNLLDTNAAYQVKNDMTKRWIMNLHTGTLINKGLIAHEGVEESEIDQIADDASSAASDVSYGEEARKKLTELGGLYIWVMSLGGHIYATSQFTEKMKDDYFFHHTSFLSKKPVACGGEMGVVQGTIKWIDNQSGHYKPGIAYLWQALKEFQRKGVDLSQVKIAPVGFERDFEDGKHFVQIMNAVMTFCGGSFEEGVAEKWLKIVLDSNAFYDLYKEAGLLDKAELLSTKQIEKYI